MICTGSSDRLRVSLRMTTIPMDDRRSEPSTSTISLTTRRTSPGRVGRTHFSSAPAPTRPPAIGSPSMTRRRIVSTATCQPLATSPPKKPSAAHSSSRCKGCGSKSVAKLLIASASILNDPLSKVRPTSRSSKNRGRWSPVPSPEHLRRGRRPRRSAFDLSSWSMSGGFSLAHVCRFADGTLVLDEKRDDGADEESPERSADAEDRHVRHRDD